MLGAADFIWLLTSDASNFGLFGESCRAAFCEINELLTASRKPFR